MIKVFDDKIAYENKGLIEYLKSVIEPGSTVLDIGCGPKIYATALIDHGCTVTTIDAWEKCQPDILVDLSKTRLDDVIDGKFDYIIMLDFIEHIEKHVGLDLIEQCKKIANKQIYLLTPLADIWTDNHENVENEDYWCYGNDFDLHQSLWSTVEFVNWTELKIKAKLKGYFFGVYSV